MKEIEVKILNINKEDIIKKILEIGGEKILDAFLDVVHFDFPDKRLWKDRKMLRVRTIDDKTNGKKVEVTFKKLCDDEKMKICDEIMIFLDDFDKICEVFKRTGMVEIVHKQKYRESYSFEDVRFEIDTYPDTPTYLEIEGPTPERVEFFVKKLGFTMEDTTKRGDIVILEDDYGKDSKKLIFKK